MACYFYKGYTNIRLLIQLSRVLSIYVFIPVSDRSDFWSEVAEVRYGMERQRLYRLSGPYPSFWSLDNNTYLRMSGTFTTHAYEFLNWLLLRRRPTCWIGWSTLSYMCLLSLHDTWRPSVPFNRGLSKPVRRNGFLPVRLWRKLILTSNLARLWRRESIDKGHTVILSKALYRGLSVDARCGIDSLAIAWWRQHSTPPGGIRVVVVHCSSKIKHCRLSAGSGKCFSIWRSCARVRSTHVRVLCTHLCKLPELISLTQCGWYRTHLAILPFTSLLSLLACRLDL